ncbi:hypothetical protein G6O67_000488 [Ophiocordyceps sinensis]|uniref:Uncharacterized protein n=1 Tax=Ophiocordyceps sinensis TaxID=72228 RepID=A0A8H4VA14_9HYPO|nr:hypothetical protein G6O67_000488 [Ophiocordyceps sinensis]
MVSNQFVSAALPVKVAQDGKMHLDRDRNPASRHCIYLSTAYGPIVGERRLPGPGIDVLGANDPGAWLA